MARTQVTSAMMKAPETGTLTYGASNSVLRSITTDESGRVVNSLSTLSLNPAWTYEIQENFIRQVAPFDGNVKSVYSGNGGWATIGALQGLDVDSNNSGSFTLYAGSTAAGTSGPQQGAGIGTDGSPSVTVSDHQSIRFYSYIQNQSAVPFDNSTKKGFGRFGLMQARSGTNEANYTVLPDPAITASGYEPKYGIYFRIKNSAVLECVTRSNNVETVTTTSVSLLQNIWKKLAFNYTLNLGTESVIFAIDDVVVATHTTNITKKLLGIAMHVYKDFGSGQTSTDPIQFVIRNYFLQLYKTSTLF
jgi:hypothetical protein